MHLWLTNMGLIRFNGFKLDGNQCIELESGFDAKVKNSEVLSDK